MLDQTSFVGVRYDEEYLEEFDEGKNSKSDSHETVFMVLSTLLVSNTNLYPFEKNKSM